MRLERSKSKKRIVPFLHYTVRDFYEYDQLSEMNETKDVVFKNLAVGTTCLSCCLRPLLRARTDMCVFLRGGGGDASDTPRAAPCRNGDSVGWCARSFQS